MPLRLLAAASRLADAPGAEVVVFDDAANLSRAIDSPARYLRIRDLDGVPDLSAVAAFDGVLLSGAEGAADVERLGARLAVLEAERGIEHGALRIVPAIDTARGVLALASIEPLPRLAGIACDPERLAASLRCAIDAPAVVQARGLTVLAAAACGVPAILVVREPAPEVGREGFGGILLDDRL